jgi:hypothetical protein
MLYSYLRTSWTIQYPILLFTTPRLYPLAKGLKPSNLSWQSLEDYFTYNQRAVNHLTKTSLSKTKKKEGKGQFTACLPSS